MRVSENGGTPVLVVPIEAGEQVDSPQMLPDGKTVLFTLTNASGATRWDQAQIVAHSLDTGQRTTLLTGASDARYVPTGHLVYALEDDLFAVPFDLERLEPAGGPVSIVEGIQRAADPESQSATANYGFSNRGALVYVEGNSDHPDRILARVDRNGTTERLNARTAPYLSPRVSPDGNRVAVQTTDSRGRSAIWVYDLSGTTAIRRLPGQGNNSRPVWTPKDDRLTFASDREGPTSIYWQPADGSGVAERLTTAEAGTEHYPESWHPDGRTLSFAVATGADRGIWTLSLDNPKNPELFYDASGNQHASIFSPDGKWIAYHSVESGTQQVYVRPFPKVPGVFHAPTQDGGASPLWSPNGELFYRREFVAERGRALRAIDITTEPRFTFGNERALNVEGFLFFQFYRDYDIHPTDGRFLMVFPAASQTAAARPPFTWS